MNPCRPFKFSVNGRDALLAIPDNDVAEGVAREVVDGTAYPIYCWFHDVRRIIDIGANVGVFSVLMANVFPEATILAYEPDYEAFEMLMNNAAPYLCPRSSGPGIHLRNQAVSNVNAKAILYRGKSGTIQSSLFHSPSTTDEQFSEVEVVDSKRMFTPDRQIDIVKIDTEGNEINILRGLGWLRLKAIRYLYLEFHSERDKVWIERRLHKTHAIFSGRIRNVCNGELLYVRRDELPHVKRAQQGAVVSC